MRTLTAGVALLAALAVAACGGSDATSTSTSTITHARSSGGASVSGDGTTRSAITVTRTATVVAAGGAGSGSATSGAGASTTTPGVPACVAAGLALSFLGQQGATGHGELGFALRNTGTARCSTVGYPGVQFLSADGGPLPTTPTHTTSDFFGHTARRALIVAPGQTVSFRLGVTHGEASGAGCTTAAALKVIAPNDTAALTTPIPDGASECATATVSPLQAGESAYP